MAWTKLSLASFFLGFLCFLSFTTFGQHSEITRKNNKVKNYSSAKFKKNRKMAEICPIFHLSEYPYQGIGFRVGDPFAISYRFYATEHITFGVDVGPAASGLYSDLYRDKFDELEPPPDSTYLYQGHQVLNQNVFIAQIFYYKEGPRAIKGLDIYFGIGWEVQFVDVKYDYLIIENFPPNNAKNGKDPITMSFKPMGPIGTFGLEYAYFSLPITIFLDGSLFYDTQEDWRRIQGGIGIRYVF